MRGEISRPSPQRTRLALISQTKERKSSLDQLTRSLDASSCLVGSCQAISSVYTRFPRSVFPTTQIPLHMSGNTSDNIFQILMSQGSRKHAKTEERENVEPRALPRKARKTNTKIGAIFYRFLREPMKRTFVLFQFFFLCFLFVFFARNPSPVWPLKKASVPVRLFFCAPPQGCSYSPTDMLAPNLGLPTFRYTFFEKIRVVFFCFFVFLF